MFKQIALCENCKFYNCDFPPIFPKVVNVSVPIMFIGENPSWAKNIQEPLGSNTKSGKSFEEHYLKKIGLNREDVWITNLFKCRYPKDFHKKSNEKTIMENASVCVEKWLVQEILYAKPKIIITLSAKQVFSRFNKILKLDLSNNFEKVAGNKHDIEVKNHKTILFPMVHPDILSNNSKGLCEKWMPIHQNEHIPKLKQLLLSL
jgi:DNA polymerase